MDLDKFRNKYTNKKLKKIVNVYQLDYINGKSPGLGDFIRGSFCFLQIAKLLNLEFKIDISNHPMSKYLKKSKNIEGLDYNNIIYYYEYNRDKEGHNNYERKPININDDFLNKTIIWLNSIDSEVFGFFSNAFPCFNKYSEEGKHLIKSNLQPNDFMETYIDNTLNELGLSKKGYGVIHIRTGDHHLVNNEPLKDMFINKIKILLNKITVSNRRYLILSDSNVLKSVLKCYPNFYIFIRNIEHLGGEHIKNHESDGIMNTLLDFYLMSFSNAVISLSVYEHVSGFSKYSSVLNNVPMYFIKI